MASNKITVNPNAKDYDKYDFSGYELTENDKGGYDWTDSSGNKHSLYSGEKGGLIHSITGADGTSSNYAYNGTRYNEYIGKLNKGAKKAYKAQTKSPKTNVTQKATQPKSSSSTTPSSSGIQVIIMMDENGNPRKVGTTSDKEAVGLITGKSVANSFEAIANANVGDFWVDKDSNIHVVTNRDIEYSKGVLEGKYVNDKDKRVSDKEHPSTTPEQPVSQSGGNNETKTSVTEKPELPVGLDKSDDLNEIRKEINALEMSKWDDSNPYARQRYQQLVNKAADHPDADSNDKDKAELVNTAWNLNNKKLYVSPYDEMRHSSEQRKAIEKSLKGGEGKERRLMGIIPSFLLGEYGNYKRSKIDKDEIYPIVSPEGKTIGYMDKKDAEWYVNKENKKLGENDKKFSIGPKETTHYRISDGDTTYYFDDEQSAKDKKKEIDKTNQPERLKAWGEFIYRLMNSISTNDMNLSSDLSGNGRPYQSIQQKDMESRLQGNNEMYYKNEMAKNDNIRKFVELADAGIINLNTLSNEQIATLGALIGKERVQQLISIAGKQEVQYIAATQMYKNWDKNQRDIYTKWLVTEGSGPANETFLSYANGELSASDLAKRYRMQLAKGGLEIKAVEEAVRKAGLENRMTQAQVDVIKELVTEQLKAAKLTNNQRIQEMATSSVDTFAKLIDAVLPG